MIGCLQVISFSRNWSNKEKKTLPFRQRRKLKLKNPILYATARTCNFLKCTFCLYWYLPCIHEKSVPKIPTELHSRGKSDKNGILTSRRHVLYLINIFFEEYFLMSCYSKKHIGLALSFVIYEFQASNKCQDSLVQYILFHFNHKYNYCYSAMPPNAFAASVNRF